MAARQITGPRVLIALIAGVLAAALYLALRPPAIEVEAGRVTRGPLLVTIDDLAETRVRDLYTVATPITGELMRVPLKPGARVTAGKTLLATVRPADPGPLDARAVAQIQANIASLAAQAAAAEAQVESARTTLSLAERQFARAGALRQRGFVAETAFDEARAARDRASAGLRSASRASEAARQAVRAARAGLMTTRGGGLGVVAVRAPISGFVLTVPQESTRVVVAGTPLLVIGDSRELELVTDLLSSDAVQVRPGAAVSIEDWGGDRPLGGRVRLIEPYGFLKVSALGVEEQRVNVIIDLLEPPLVWARLGHGFRATVRIVTWSAPDVLRVPVGALFRSGDAWQVFRITPTGHAEAVNVTVGRMNPAMAQVIGGLQEHDRVILHPGDKIADGVRVSAPRR